MFFVVILIGFIFLLYVISRFMEQSKSPKMNKIFRYTFAVVVGLLAFLILIRGNIALGGILGLLSVLSTTGKLWNLFSSEPDVPSRASDYNLMSWEEALDILGLSGNPGQSEIKDAHHKMMLKLHPDQGGSDYLAIKINQAKDTLLG